MAESLRPGGVYKDDIGEGYHDANGKPIDPPSSAELDAIDDRTADEKQADFNLAVAAARQRGLPVMTSVEGLGVDSPKPEPRKPAKTDSPKPDEPNDGKGTKAAGE